MEMRVAKRMAFRGRYRRNFLSRAESVRRGVAERTSIGNVSLDFLWCVTEFQRDGASVSGAGGFPLRAESVGLRVEGCIVSGDISFDFL